MVTPPIADCLNAEQQRTSGVTLHRDDGIDVDALVVGVGKVGVVLANQVEGDLCQWLFYAQALAAKGYRALVFNYSGPSPDLDVVAGVDTLRSQGATKVFLLGASKGGTMVISAAARAEPAVAGVISLSAPDAMEGVDAVGAASELAVPALFVAAERDAPFNLSARELFKACKFKDKQLYVYPGTGHGTSLVSPIAGDTVSNLVEEFLRTH